MKTKFMQLSTEEKSVLARLKASLALHLVEEAGAADAGLQTICPPRGVSMKIGIRGAGPALGLQVPQTSQILPASPGRPSLLLFFPNTEAAVRVFSGAKGAVIPVPLGAGAFSALAFFRKASSRATELLRAPDTAEATRARLLLAATLYGLEAIAGESYLERRMQIVPDGVVGVRAGEIAFWVAKQGRKIHVQRDAQPGDTSPGDVLPEDAPPAVAANSPRPDALLSFAGYRSAIDVLSGKRQAVVALGSGEVHIEGLLPLVQGLFAVLDRLSWYLGVDV